MSRIRRKSNAKSIVSLVIVIAILLAAIGGITAWAKSETKTVPATAFTRGALNDTDGTFVKSKTTLVTEELFECRGLKVIPDFDNTSAYQVYWYNEDEIYLGNTDKLSASTKMVDSVPGAAVYARVVIYPAQVDEDGKPIKDFEIKLWQIVKYVKRIKLEVLRDQAGNMQNLFKDVVTYSESMGSISSVLLNHKNIFIENHSLYTGYELLEEHISKDPNRSLLILDTSKVSVYRLDLSNTSMRVGVYLYDSEGKFISHNSYASGDIYLLDLTQTVAQGAFQVAFEIYDGEAVLSEYLYRELL